MELLILTNIPNDLLESSRTDFAAYYRELYKSYPPEEFELTSIDYLDQWIQSEFDLFSKYQMIIAKVNDQIVGYCLFTTDQSYTYILQFWPAQDCIIHQVEMTVELMKLLTKPLRGVIRKSNQKGITFYKNFGGFILDNFDNFPKEIYSHYSKDIYIALQVDA